MTSKNLFNQIFNGPYPTSFFFIFLVSIQLTVTNVQYKFSLWLDSNPGPLVSEATTLSIVPTQLPTDAVFSSNSCWHFSKSRMFTQNFVIIGIHVSIEKFLRTFERLNSHPTYLPFYPSQFIGNNGPHECHWNGP